MDKSPAQLRAEADELEERAKRLDKINGYLNQQHNLVQGVCATIGIIILSLICNMLSNW